MTNSAMQRIHSILDLWRNCALLALLLAGDCWTSSPRQGFWITGVTPGPGGIAQPSSNEPVTPPAHGIEIRRQAVGPFVVIEESVPWSQPRMYHAPNPRNWIQLSFDTSDQRVNVTLTDDGGRLSATAQAPECTVVVNYLQYAPRGAYALRGDEMRLHAAMDTSLAVLGRLCGGSREAVDQYRRRFEQSSTDFSAAIRAMKGRVATVFGPRVERCLPPEPSAFVDHHWC
jgi:hypothetical protein